jgi:hypothetical protein
MGNLGSKRKPIFIKNWNSILVASTFLLTAGCATPPDNTSDVAVRVGMPRSELRLIYGEPLRIESNASGGEDWYYRFYAWSKAPTVSATVSENVGGNTISSTSESWQVGKGTEEEPIHLSPEGRVVEPLPSGKVIRN